MKKAIFEVPSVMEPSRISDNRRLLYNRIAKKYEFEIIIRNDLSEEIISKYDVVFFGPRKFLQKEYLERTITVCNVSKKTKIIAYSTDVEPPTYNRYNIEQAKLAQRMIFHRADIILGDVHELFWKIYEDMRSQWEEKYVWFPKAIVVPSRYKRLSFNKSPIMKCFVAGKIKSEYPLRTYLVKNGRDKIKYLTHPDYGKVDPKQCILKNKFANEINKYICGLCGPKFNSNILEKHMLIPATGALLLSPQVPDLDKAGFIPDEYYLPVNEQNILETIEQIFESPNNFTKIRKEGRRFIFKNHTIENRLKTFGKILRRL